MEGRGQGGNEAGLPLARNVKEDQRKKWNANWSAIRSGGLSAQGPYCQLRYAADIAVHAAVLLPAELQL